ncbi:YraN family protein [Stutzerimonas kirkiae]|uniref:UPF0102 protein DNJ96_06500 n=1 Tax=Stutzerimonas kirkiae TaxID=2211392 RepID=A0A4Q9RB71_9GAMM|nr:YraN family protein [Stutzerimonas kirkiae]TBU98076.1 YraN family protein [Stutzerimonas kirkiae]TBV02903.1 YraN family protein [Stutzerimonas kirkiae]TBV11127.1 YraN family protein [Stutzerimonas kirkiae]TBV13005.1 YraN family protein [Stutzerimonas kirkiae]
MNDDRRQDSGRAAEARALAFLSAKGLRLLARNWSCRSGEIDLVMLDGGTVVFVEVRYRKHSAWGGALESIDARKRQKLIRTAQFFLLKEQRWSNHPCRFDVIAMDSEQEINWLRNAFDG